MLTISALAERAKSRIAPLYEAARTDDEIVAVAEFTGVVSMFGLAATTRASGDWVASRVMFEHASKRLARYKDGLFYNEAFGKLSRRVFQGMAR